jgi:protein SCO1/2/putative membrane protein
MTTGETTNANRRVRCGLLATGTLLWLLVAAAGWYALRSHRSGDAARETVMPPVLAEEDLNAPDESRPSTQAAPLRIAAPAWVPYEVKDFELVDTQGQRVTKADLAGKPWVICFIFTRCAFTCPQISQAMWKLQEQLDDVDMRFVSLTVDPDFDTPVKLRNYAQTYNADPKRWLFLTGDKAEIYRLIHESFLMPVQEIVGEARKPGFEVAHSNNIMLVDAAGRVVGKYNGISDTEMVSLRKAIHEMIQAGGAPQEAAEPADDQESSLARPAENSNGNQAAPPSADTGKEEAQPSNLEGR